MTGERSTRTQRTRFDFTEPLQWIPELTDREVEIIQQRRVLDEEARSIERHRMREKLAAQVGWCLRLAKGGRIRGSEMEMMDFQHPPRRDRDGVRYVRVMALGEIAWTTADDPALRCTGFDVYTGPAMVYPLGEWQSRYGFELSDTVTQITNVEYHRAWMDAVEALTLP